MKKAIKEIILKIYKVTFLILGKLLPKKQNLIIFESFLGKQYSDNPRAIYEYMVQNNPEYKMYWSFGEETINIPDDLEIKKIQRFSIRWLFLMARAKYWISNSRLPLWIPKPKKTIYIQTWHGTPLKRLASDMTEVHMPGVSTEEYKRDFLKESSKWDYLVSPNLYSTEIFKRAFSFEKEIIESGYPRNDFLFRANDQKNIVQIKKKSNIPQDKKVILYAPTWRDNQFYNVGEYKFGLQMDLKRMQEELGEEYIVLLRLHYLISEELDLTDYPDFVFDFSNHNDIRELYVISDLLITDYSSVFFDYANLKRPILFYVYDIEEYRGNIRGFYFDLEKRAPGPLLRTTEEIIKEIKKIEQIGYVPTKKEEDFYTDFCYLEDGNAAKRVVEKLFN